METLALLAELRQMLTEQSGPIERERWWDLVLRIEFMLDADPRIGMTEMNNMLRLRSGVGAAIAAINQGQGPVMSLATMPLTALESSIRRRASGPDVGASLGHHT